MQAKSDKRTKIIVYLLCGFLAVNIIFVLFNSFHGRGALSAGISFFYGWTLATTIGTMFFKERFRKMLVGILFVLACVSAGIFLFFVIYPSSYSLHNATVQQEMLQYVLYGFAFTFYACAAYFLSRPHTMKLFHGSMNQPDK